MIERFAFARNPQVLFGTGRIEELPKIAARYGQSVLLVTGAHSYQGAAWDTMTAGLDSEGVRWFHAVVSGEPSPECIDRAVAEHRPHDINAVVAWGGGSVVDAGKAISAMLCAEGSVVDYLEGVGTQQPTGQKVPFVAIPTTAGTGSEATKNAVISRVGTNGFKKSLRHDAYVPDVALLDPELMLGCPPAVTAACGMDAFTQLLEAYVSNNASPLTDALALSGLDHIGTSLMRAYRDGASDVDARAGMAYAAFLSGVTLANAGLGLVHGLASPVGGFFDVPHGVVCGTLMGAATEANMRALREQASAHPALGKYARAGRVVLGTEVADDTEACDALIRTIHQYTETLEIPALGAYGVTEADLDRIVKGSGNKNNPVAFSPNKIREILAQRI